MRHCDLRCSSRSLASTAGGAQAVSEVVMPRMSASTASSARMSRASVRSWSLSARDVQHRAAHRVVTDLDRPLALTRLDLAQIRLANTGLGGECILRQTAIFTPYLDRVGPGQQRVEHNGGNRFIHAGSQF